MPAAGLSSTTQLRAENTDLRTRLAEAEETLRAIREGEVDAIVVSGSKGNRVFALAEADNLPRLMIETMNEAGLATTPDGTLLFCNDRTNVLLGRPKEDLLGHNLANFIAPDDAGRFRQLLQAAATANADARLEFIAATGAPVPMHVWANRLDRADGPLICLVATDLSRIEADRRLIAELEKQKEALRASEERYRALFSTMQEGFCIIEMLFDANQRAVDYRFLEVNPAFESQTGMRNAKGRRILELVPELEKHWFDIYGKVARTGKPARFMNEARALKHWYDVSAYRVGGPGSRKVAVFFNDVTERKEAQDMLLQAHDKLEQRVHERTAELTRINITLKGLKAFSESLIQLAPTMIAVVDREGNLIRTNAYAEQLTGYPFTEIKGRSMVELFIPEAEQPRALHALEQTLRGRPVSALVAPLRLKDGSIRQIEWFTKAISSGGKISGVLAIGHDITERKQAEEALRRSEHELTNFFDQAPIGLLWVKPNGQVLRINQAQLALLGGTGKEVLRRPIARFFADSKAITSLLQRLAQGETVRNFHLRLRQKDRSLRHVIVDANGLWENRQLIHSRWFVRDITRRIELEREILSISEREKRRLGHDLHDDLCQQLAGITFLSHTLAGQLDKKSDANTAQAKKIGQLAQNAMTQTRELAHGLSPVAMEAKGLMGALENLAVQTANVFRVECRFQCKNPVLLSDHVTGIHLFRIAQEAVGNAIKHGHARRIDLALTANGSQVMLSVNDNGAGIPLKLGKKGGMGLRIMQYRAGVIGASLLVQRNPRGGTMVVCSVPQGIVPSKKNGKIKAVKIRLLRRKKESQS